MYSFKCIEFLQNNILKGAINDFYKRYWSSKYIILMHTLFFCFWEIPGRKLFIKFSNDQKDLTLVDHGCEDNKDVIFDELYPWYQKYLINILPNFLRNFDVPILHN